MYLFSRLFKRERKEPCIEKKRPECPFYGFFLPPIGSLVFLDQKGNQCPLIPDSYSPCQMETSGETPNWHNCRFNTEKNRASLKGIVDQATIFPEEFRPQEKEYHGMPMRKWVEKILGDENELR